MLSDLYVRLRSLICHAKVEEELDDELRFHQEQQAEKYMRAGMSREEALRQVRLDFGGLEQVKEDCREARGVSFLESVAQDLRYGLRMLMKSPMFTAVIILTLGLGIGANTAIFTLVNAVMLRSIPVRDPQQLVVAQWSARKWPQNVGTSGYGDCAEHRNATTVASCSLPYALLQEIQNQKEVFADAMAFAGPSQMNISDNGAATIAQGELVSGGYFQTLGVSSALGRTLVPDDEKPAAPSVVVLDYAYWQRAFGGSPEVIGRTIHLNNAVFTIVGVTEPGFTRLTPGKPVDFWVALNQAPALGKQWMSRSHPDNWWLVVVGRLQSGVSRAQAQASIDGLFLNATTHGAKQHWAQSDNPHLRFLPAQQGLTGIRNIYGEPLLLLMAAVGLILLIACANVAGLMLARAAAREREMAVRLAMGAAHRRVIRQLLTESLLLSFLGTSLGAVLAAQGVSALAAFFTNNAWSRLQLDLHVDARVLLFTIGVALLTGIGFGLAPAFRGSRTSVTVPMKGNTTTAASRGPGRILGLGSALVVLQVALSMVVLTGAGLLLRSLDNLRKVNAGFDTRNLMIFDISPQLAGYKDQQIPALYANLKRQIAAVPGVSNVSYASAALLDGGYDSQDMKIEGRAEKRGVEVLILSVGSDFFPTMRIPLLEGRLLNETDTAATKHAVVNRSFVTKFLAGRNPLGVHFGGGDPKDPRWEIVGVVGDTKYATPRSEDAPTAFLPFTSGGASFEVRTALDPPLLMPAVRNVVNAVDAGLPVMRMRTESHSVDRLLFNERLVARLFGLFAALGLLLACIGLYGLLSYEVERRMREIGIRTALGAQRSTIWSMVVRNGILVVTVGALAGCAAAFGVTRLLTNLLYAVRPTDPLTFALTACLLLLVGILACSLPAGRATRVDPMSALRCE